MALNSKQKRFADEWLTDRNATRAAKAAGYSEKTAYSLGQRLLKNAEVDRYIKLKQKKVDERLEVTGLSIVNRLAAIGFSGFADFGEVIAHKHTRKIRGKFVETVTHSIRAKATADIDPSKLPALSMVRQTKDGIEIKLHDQIRALELLGRHAGIFEKDNKQREQPIIVAPFTDKQVDKILTTLREKKK